MRAISHQRVVRIQSPRWREGLVALLAGCAASTQKQPPWDKPGHYHMRRIDQLRPALFSSSHTCACAVARSFVCDTWVRGSVGADCMRVWAAAPATSGTAAFARRRTTSRHVLSRANVRCTARPSRCCVGRPAVASAVPLLHRRGAHQHQREREHRQHREAVGQRVRRLEAARTRVRQRARALAAGPRLGICASGRGEQWREGAGDSRPRLQGGRAQGCAVRDGASSKMVTLLQ